MIGSGIRDKRKNMKEIFDWKKEEFGGTEFAAEWFSNNVSQHMKNMHNYYCMLVPGPGVPEDKLFGTQQKIVWLHILPDQIVNEGKKLFYSQDFLQTISHMIVTSNFHKEKVISQIGFPRDKIYVIQNPMAQGIPYNPNKFNLSGPVKIIHASQMERGMDMLLRAALLIDEDFELNIFNDFYPEHSNWDFVEECLRDDRINFYGKTPRKTLFKHFSNSHIHAYPSTHAETSCLVQVEAMAAGNLCVYSNIGALPETSLGHGAEVDFLNAKSYQDALEKYKLALENAIKTIKNKNFDPSDQISDILNNRSDKKIVSRWKDFDRSLQ